MSQEPDTPPPVRQRNTTPYPYTFAETESGPAYTVLPGETAEHPALLDGWTALDDEPEKQAAEPTPKPSRKRAATADTETSDGGEPQ
ncbi:hypothetical protein STRTUCAR8_08549 [Streptomyces turgidiscabies Car8]|uniref:Uncharacterized protein n=1 Tax=Streptomyces turgidiscabies (strain Car8) TaxID=698760 RepID=L7FAL3_STRT8|nr:hypothetical protein [Streptomyces turgidiscabies]ELP67705.1 hypothetical protein STRTUCAR8_08549 [Streptomyces turgidiscabies Car8]